MRHQLSVSTHADAGEIAAARNDAARAGTLNVPVTESNAWSLVRARLCRAHDAWLKNDVHRARRAGQHRDASAIEQELRNLKQRLLQAH